MGSIKKKLSKEEAEKIVKECFSIADFCRKVGWEPRGDNYKTFHRYVKDYNLDTSHFIGIKSNTGNKNNLGSEKSAIEYSKSTYVRSSTLLKKLIKEGIKEWRCERCKNTEWLGEKIMLEVHHKDGNHLNNDINNIELLCPNCHAKTDSYRGRKNKRSEKKYCKYCGKEVSKWSVNFVCQECSHKRQRKIEWPSKEELLEYFNNKNISEISRIYGVSFQTVKKWLKRYEIL